MYRRVANAVGWVLLALASMGLGLGMVIAVCTIPY